MKSILLLLFIVISVRGYSQVSFRNNTQYPVYVAVAFYEKTSSYEGFRSQGWYTVIPGATNQIFNGTPSGGYFFYYVKDEHHHEWSGKTKFLVQSDKFDIQNANKDYQKNIWRSWKNFVQWPVLSNSNTATVININ